MTELDRMTWALCPVFLACEDCDMPQIMFGPHPECRKCPGPDENGGQAGCRIPAEIAARIALGRTNSGDFEEGRRAGIGQVAEAFAKLPAISVAIRAMGDE